MYKVASDGRQRALHHGKLADWANGEERLSLEDQLNQKLDGLKILEARILSMPKSPERSELGRQKLALQGEIGAFRKRIGRVRVAREGIEHIFLSLAKEMLSRPQFNAVWQCAVREHEKRQSELGEIQQ